MKLNTGAKKPDQEEYAYFDKCSDGGHETVMEALRCPNDFNGIIAGARVVHIPEQFALAVS